VNASKLAQLTLWTFVAGAAGALVGVPLGVEPLPAALIAGGADVVALALRVSLKAKAKLEDELEADEAL
jgi:ABC-type uncharacterized transport system permease subunit